MDFFVSVAKAIKSKLEDENIVFAFIGSGYDPINDYSVSIWVKGQIERSGLQDNLVILGKTKAYRKIVEGQIYS